MKTMYKCTKTSGGGRQDDAGDWEMKETKKSIIFTRIRKPIFGWGYDGDSLICRKDNCCNHTIHDWEDGTYTVYPMMNGTPFYFEPF